MPILNHGPATESRLGEITGGGRDALVIHAVDSDDALPVVADGGCNLGEAAEARRGVAEVREQGAQHRHANECAATKRREVD